MKKTKEIVQVDIPKELALLKIKTPEEMQGAAGMLAELKRQLKAVVEEKEKVTVPLFEALKAERERFKPYEAKLEGAIEIVKSEMSAYQMRVIAAQKSAEKRAVEAVASGKMSLDKAVGVIEKAGSGLVSKDGIGVAGGGSVKFRVDKVVKVVDVEKVPRRYMTIDMKAVREALVGGVEVAGCVLEEVQTPVVRG